MGFAQTSVPYNWTFEQIKQDPLRDLEAVKASRDIFCDNETNHCIMLLNDFGSDGILVESEGYDYPWYRNVYKKSLLDRYRKLKYPPK